MLSRPSKYNLSEEKCLNANPGVGFSKMVQLWVQYRSSNSSCETDDIFYMTFDIHRKTKINLDHTEIYLFY